MHVCSQQQHRTKLPAALSLSVGLSVSLALALSNSSRAHARALALSLSLRCVASSAKAAVEATPAIFVPQVPMPACAYVCAYVHVCCVILITRGTLASCTIVASYRALNCGDSGL
jgi:hypothetical protein